MENFPEEIKQLLEEYKRVSPIKIRTLPEIDLYMDQLTTFMEEKLKNQRRYPEDKILTKTMINNYTKNHLFPPPEKKKYTQDHLITLLYTYYLKNMLTISDIRTLLTPMTEAYWNNFREAEEAEGLLSLKEIYQTLFANIDTMVEDLDRDITRTAERAENLFVDRDLSPEEVEYLQKFSFVAMLGLDVYMKKRLMEIVIDTMKEADT